MSSKKRSSTMVFFLAINVLFCIAANACYTCNNPPKPQNPTTTSSKGSCPRDALKLGICAKVLNGSVVGTIVGSPPDSHCCSLLGGLVDLEAALCLCTALKANILGINLDIPIALSLLINTCGKNLPSDFLCA